VGHLRYGRGVKPAQLLLQEVLIVHRKIRLIVVGLACCGAFELLRGTWPTVADEQVVEQAPLAGNVAMLDLARIFNNHREFKRLSDDLRREVEDAERELKTHKAELQAEADALAKLNRGTPEAKQLESKIARDTAELQVKVAEQKKEFFEEEAGIYFQIYQQVMKEVEKYAAAHGINLVMRFSGEPMDPNDAQAVQKELNKAVLFHKGIDITDEILALANAEPQR
jgi:Skp family chaperone for outer membrane proteins